MRTYVMVAAVLMAVGCGSDSNEGPSTGGTAGSSGSGGTAGSSGSGGTAGSGASGGTAGSGASGGTAGSGASGGTAGSGASGGTAGSGASGGTAGSPTGGTGGTAGSPTGGTGGTAGSGGAFTECKEASDCKLVSDCCNCEGVPASAPAGPSCDLACITPMCEDRGIRAASCVAGRCVAGFSCDERSVTCRQEPPDCKPGEVPIVDGDCWEGTCAPATECKSVGSCAACGSLACVTYVTQLGPEYHCVDMPPTCDEASCGCLGGSCQEPFDTCNDIGSRTGISCSCPRC